VQPVILSRIELVRLFAGAIITVSQGRAPITHVAGPRPRRGTCRVCGCTDALACEGGCWWADKAHTLCSSCLHVVGEL
jgi:hypothetical protein